MDDRICDEILGMESVETAGVKRYMDRNREELDEAGLGCDCICCIIQYCFFVFGRYIRVSIMKSGLRPGHPVNGRRRWETVM